MVSPENTNWLSDYPLIEGAFSDQNPTFPWQIDGSASVRYLLNHVGLVFFVCYINGFWILGFVSFTICWFCLLALDFWCFRVGSSIWRSWYGCVIMLITQFVFRWSCCDRYWMKPFVSVLHISSVS